MKFTEHNERVLEKFASMIIQRMEDMKAGHWEKGWVGKTIGGLPVNIEGSSYGGSNIFWLMLHCSASNYKYPIYCTLKQANRLGAHIKKGASSMPIIFWDLSVTTETGQKINSNVYFNMSQVEKNKCHAIPFLKSYNVFNIEQTNLEDVCPDKLKVLKSRFGIDEEHDESGMYDNKQLDTLLEKQTWLCPIEYRKPSDSAYYSPISDKIVVPMKSQFKQNNKDDYYRNGQEFYSTLLHEMVHSTGTEKRLNRTTGKHFGDNLYAKEELVAELGAARIGQQLGFDKRILDNNAAYLDCWISSLKKEPKYVLSLMGDVDKASRIILDKIAV